MTKLPPSTKRGKMKNDAESGLCGSWLRELQLLSGKADDRAWASFSKENVAPELDPWSGLQSEQQYPF